jgi:5-hydroxyisourate hydrolase
METLFWETQLMTGNGAKKGFLTTHVLDTALGCPAAKISVSVSRIVESKIQLIATDKTNDDGRLAKPILSGEEFSKGTYELVFNVGEYFENLSKWDSLPFFDRIPIRFKIWNEDEHYHVPLLLSPFGYSTYRGS